MVENSKIEWTDHTFNPWIGCQKVSPGCDNCYAESWADRWGHVEWGPGAERKRTRPANWNKPKRWNLDAMSISQDARARVFCASLADVFDNAVPDEWRDDLWQLIRETPRLDWMLLTKRPQNVADMLPEDFYTHDSSNIWLGTSVENQAEADRRIPILSEIPVFTRFLSAEPLLGPIDLSPWITMEVIDHFEPPPFDLVIAGGESGRNKRPMDLQWARDLRDQCSAAQIAFFMKQLDKIEPIPDDLMIRQMPSWSVYERNPHA